MAHASIAPSCAVARYQSGSLEVWTHSQPFEHQIAIKLPLAVGGGAERNAVPLYDFAQWRAVSHRTLIMPIQTVSWVLKEAVQFDRTRILSNTWESYPILRFSEVPAVEVQIINHPEQNSGGAGEATHGPVAAAIANAVADALGIRVRNMPLTTDNITKAAIA